MEADGYADKEHAGKEHDKKMTKGQRWQEQRVK